MLVASSLVHLPPLHRTNSIIANLLRDTRFSFNFNEVSDTFVDTVERQSKCGWGKGTELLQHCFTNLHLPRSSRVFRNHFPFAGIYCN